MEVILLERIGKLGGVGDRARVKSGYARNYLLPQGKVLRATKENLAYIQKEREKIEARDREAAEAARTLAGEISGLSLVILRSAGETGQLYGSVGARDIVNELAAKLPDGASPIGKDKVVMNRLIKEVGMHKVSLVLHPEARVELDVNVARNEEEAEIQAAGGEIPRAGSEKAETAAEEETGEEAGEDASR